MVSQAATACRNWPHSARSRSRARFARVANASIQCRTPLASKRVISTTRCAPWLAVGPPSGPPSKAIFGATEVNVSELAYGKISSGLPTLQYTGNPLVNRWRTTVKASKVKPLPLPLPEFLQSFGTARPPILRGGQAIPVTGSQCSSSRSILNVTLSSMRF